VALDRRAVGVGQAAGAVVHEDERVVLTAGRLSSSTATLVDSALAGRVSAALSVVTELNFPLSGTMNTASTTHKPSPTTAPTDRPTDRRRFPGRRSVDCHH
jgi:hypothetical protein